MVSSSEQVILVFLKSLMHFLHQIVAEDTSAEGDFTFPNVIVCTEMCGAESSRYGLHSWVMPRLLLESLAIHENIIIEILVISFWAG